MLRRASLVVALVAALGLGACGFALDTKSDVPATTTTIPGVAAPPPPAAADETSTTLPPEPPWCRELGTFTTLTYAVGQSNDPLRIEELMAEAMEDLRTAAAQAPDPLGASIDAVLAILEPAIATADAEQRWLELRQIATELQEDHPAETEAFLTQGREACPSFADSLDGLG